MLLNIANQTFFRIKSSILALSASFHSSLWNVFRRLLDISHYYIKKSTKIILKRYYLFE